MSTEAYTFTMTCEAVPTQVEGRRASDDAPYYFRARHGTWTLDVGDPSWPTHLLDWPTNDWVTDRDLMVATGDDPTRGFMSEDEVRAVLDRHLVIPALANVDRSTE